MKNIEAPLREFLDQLGMQYKPSEYLATITDKKLPIIGLAISGGGYRALLNGAGFLAAVDKPPAASSVHKRGGGEANPTPPSLEGLLQSSTYLVGLSGGSWLISSFAINGFKPIIDYINGKMGFSVWQFQHPIWTGPEQSGAEIRRRGKLEDELEDELEKGEEKAKGDVDKATEAVKKVADKATEDVENGLGDVTKFVEYWKALVTEVMQKSSAGFKTSITDLWGRALSFQLVASKDGGPGLTFSSLASMTQIENAEMPLPIIVTDSRSPADPGKQVLVTDSVFEINPYELCSFDLSVYGCAPLKYVGSKFNSDLNTGGTCVTGYDRLSFCFGTSSSLFNQFLLQKRTLDDKITGEFTSKIAKDIVGKALEGAANGELKILSEDDDDVANWEPNPFQGWSHTTKEGVTYDNPFKDTPVLTLVDGGEKSGNVPLNPLLLPQRSVDVIFAVDSSADTKDPNDLNWPAGNAPRTTYARSKDPIAKHLQMPEMPDAETFMKRGFNNRPVIFGAEDAGATYPVIVYIPNAPYSYASNADTYKMQYTVDERNAMVQNGYNVATMGNGTIGIALDGARDSTDPAWLPCVGCAILKRSWDRTKTTITEECKTCFKFYGYGTKKDQTGDYHPPLKMGQAKVGV